jgi:hypothetical protein
MFACPATDDFFRSRIDQMIDLRHPLAVLASRMPWQGIEARVTQVFSRKGRAGVAMPDLDLFGEQAQRVAVASNTGRPRVPLRIIIGALIMPGSKDSEWCWPFLYRDNDFRLQSANYDPRLTHRGKSIGSSC